MQSNLITLIRKSKCGPVSFFRISTILFIIVLVWYYYSFESSIKKPNQFQRKSTSPFQSLRKRQQRLGVVFSGGLGNQMFMYASALGIAMQLDNTFLLNPECAPELYNSFQLSVNSTSQRRQSVPVKESANSSLCERWPATDGLREVVSEDDENPVFDGELLARVIHMRNSSASEANASKVILINGFLQSFKFFPSAAVIREQFTFHKQVLFLFFIILFLILFYFHFSLSII